MANTSISSNLICMEYPKYNMTSFTLNKSITDQEKTLYLVKHYLYEIILPAVCVFGFIGNILNIVIFTRKRRRRMEEVEWSTTTCLIALAVSDLLFCLCVFPSAFLPGRTVFGPWEFMLYYKAYSTVAISTFIMSSTTLTVVTAILRYVGICYPFHSRQLITSKSTTIIVMCVWIFSISFNLPELWRYNIQNKICIRNKTYILIRKSELFQDEMFIYAYKLLWAITGNFIPLALLFYSNIRLIQALHKSRVLHLKHCSSEISATRTHRRITVTLVTIIVSFFMLVAPSEITKFIFYFNKKNNKDFYTYQMVSMVTNTLQIVNFSVNFFLYYIFLSPFRRAVHKFLCPSQWRKKAEDNSVNNTLTLLSVRRKV